MRILVCPPVHFAVEYVINPWMEAQRGRVNAVLATEQWYGLVEDLARVATILEVVPEPGSPDMCFTANAGLVADGRFIPARFRMSERQAEEGPFRAWFEENGFESASLAAREPFEGEGDALFQPGRPLLWAGHGPRSDVRVHSALAAAWDVEVVSLRLIDPRFYHLDTCFAPLSEGRVAYYPPAFDAEGRAAIEHRIPATHRIELDEGDALGFAANLLRIDDRIFLNHASDSLRARLARWGFETRLHPVGEFLKAGGGVKCLSLLLDQEPFRGLSADAAQASGTANETAWKQARVV
jgi:N-dimethylarginine dimethylaminohydrolase